MIDNIAKKVESLRLQECSLKNRSLWKLQALIFLYSIIEIEERLLLFLYKYFVFYCSILLTR